jgi:hypothetical protein
MESAKNIREEVDDPVGTKYDEPGKQLSLPGISFLRLENVKFAELWVEQDMAGLQQKLRG